MHRTRRPASTRVEMAPPVRQAGLAIATYRAAVKRGLSVVVAITLGVSALAGWMAGSVHGSCEYSCPAQGPCPAPADCLQHPFNWTAAEVAGLLVGMIVAALGVAVLRQRISE